MNILGLIFSLLLILSYGFYATWDKQTAASRLRRTYVGHQNANRKLLNHYQSELYRSFRGKGEATRPKEKKSPSKTPKKPALNRDCAKLNIWPLIQEGRDNHPFLYELTAKMIRTFYSPLIQGKRFEYHFLDNLLDSAKAQQETALEKIALKDPDLQRVYYKMLKGTRQGYPPLLDYLKAEQSPSKLCLFHAHPDLIALFLGPTAASNLYEEIHRENGSLLTQELVEKFSNEAHQITLDSELFKLLELGRPEHQEYKKTLIAEDRDVQLRKTVYLKS